MRLIRFILFQYIFLSLICSSYHDELIKHAPHADHNSSPRCPKRCQCEEVLERNFGKQIAVFCHQANLNQDNFASIIRELPDDVTILDIVISHAEPSQFLWDDDLNRFKRLKTLKLINCGIPAISRALRLPNLEELNLEGNRIEHISLTLFAGVPSIRTLNLANNLLSVLPTGAFTYLRKMDTLILSHNNITELSANIFRGLTNLKTLHLDGNKIPAYQLNNLISDVAQLEKLELNYCELHSLNQANLSKFKSIEHLGLVGNDLKVIPTNYLRNIHGLTSINLAENGIRSIASNAFSSTKINRVLLAGNKLGQSPFALKSDSFANMKLYELDLSYNDFEYFDTSFLGTAQSTIQTLHLSGNRIWDFPGRITANMTSLRHLHLADNDISNIPEIMPLEYTRLRFLNISHNDINELPDYLDHILPELKMLDISNNKISSFAFSVLDSFINRLEQVYLSRNPWNCGCLIDGLKKHMIERYEHRWTLGYDNTRCSTPEKLKNLAIYRLNHISDCAVLFGARFGLSQVSELTILFALLVSIAIVASIFIFILFYRHERKLKLKAKYSDFIDSQSRITLNLSQQLIGLPILSSELLTSQSESPSPKVSAKRIPPPPPPPILTTF